MAARSYNYGSTVQCHGHHGYHRMDARRSLAHHPSFPPALQGFDTQFLFPKSIYNTSVVFAVHYQREEDAQSYVPSFDRVFRTWKKSDPFFTGAFDRRTVEYIVDSEEGRKYYHFFSRFIMASEEHYLASLLYNWNRTRAFVTSLAAQAVWNTWTYGINERANDGLKTHTHFLNVTELAILRGMAKRGVLFARKFSTEKTAELLNVIDEQLLGIDCAIDTYCQKPASSYLPPDTLYNISNIGGKYWPGFIPIPTDTDLQAFRRYAVKTGEEQFPDFL